MNSQILLRKLKFRIFCILLSLFFCSVSVSQAEVYNYNCNSQNFNKTISVDSEAQDLTFVKSIQPLDNGLPAIEVSLAYNYTFSDRYIFKFSERRIALVIKNGAATTAVFADPGQSLIATFKSGEVMPGAWGGGPPQTSEFYIICNPIEQTDKQLLENLIDGEQFTTVIHSVKGSGDRFSVLHPRSGKNVMARGATPQITASLKANLGLTRSLIGGWDESDEENPSVFIVHRITKVQ